MTAIKLLTTHDPKILYLASIERIETARRVLDHTPCDFAAAAYLAGLAVEAVLQANAIRSGAAHDAHHSLPRWLARCPRRLNDSLRYSSEWTETVSLWDNRLRYLSYNGLVNYYRKKHFIHGVKGVVGSRVRTVTKSFVTATGVIHSKGVAQWLDY